MADPLVNCRLGVANYGEYEVCVLEIAHGIEIIASESQSRLGRAYYPRLYTDDNFDLRMIFRSHAEQERFCKWIVGYIRRKSDPNDNVGEMRVVVPRYAFDKVGVPSSAVPFGTSVGLVTYPVAMTFTGTAAPIAHTSPYVSAVTRAENPENDPAIPYLTPDDVQLSGDQFGADRIYDIGEADLDHLGTGIFVPEPRRPVKGPF